MTSLKSFCVAMLLSAAVLPSSDAAVRDVAMYIDDSVATDETFCADVNYMYATIGVKNAIVSFYADTAQDAALLWEGVDEKSCLKRPEGVLFSLNFGSDAAATWKETVPATFGDAMGIYLPANSYTGLDISPDSLTKGCEATEIDKLVALTTSLSIPGITITHSPLASYFSTTGTGFCATADSKSYLDVETGTSAIISKYYVKYYNVGDAYTYNSYDLIFQHAGDGTDGTADGLGAGSAYCEINTAMASLGPKIVIGKTLTTTDGAANGFIDTATVNDIICTAEKTNGYTNGVVFWRYNGQTDALYTDITTACYADGATLDCTAIPTPDDGSSTSTTTTGAIGTMTVSVLAVVSVGMMALL